MIVVLEDEATRVEALRCRVAPVPVRWETTVRGFVEALREVPEPLLVILDHDLGESGDAGGLDGLHAAERMPVVCCLVLVWSFNVVRAPLMVAALQRRSMNARWAPVRSWDCDTAIAAACRRA